MPLARAELGDRQAAGGMPREAAAPEALELGILGSCHGLAPGLVDRDQPTTIATLARMVLPDAYTPRGQISQQEQ